MPRYYFHLHDHTDEPDHEGTELPDPHAAKVDAILFATSVLRDQPDLLTAQRPLCVAVKDADGARVCLVTIKLDEA